MQEPVAIRPLTEIAGEEFAAEIRKAVPPTLKGGDYIAPVLTVVIGQSREILRDAVLSLLQEYTGDIYAHRTVFISDHPEEIPARPPKEGASMEEYTYAPALFSVSPEKTNLPDNGVWDQLLGPAPSTTRLAKAIQEFLRWDIDIFAILSPLEMYSWPTAVQASLVGSFVYATTERISGEVVHVGEEAIQSLTMLGAATGEGSVTFIDLDQKKIFRTLAEANITA